MKEVSCICDFDNNAVLSDFPDGRSVGQGKTCARVPEVEFASNQRTVQHAGYLFIWVLEYQYHWKRDRGCG